MGISVRGSLSRGVSVWRGVSVQGGLCLGGLSRGISGGEEGLCPGGLSPGEGGLCPGVSVWGSLSRGVSVRETPYGNERALRILLECILVNKLWF